VANTNRANAMRTIASQIDTSRFATGEDISQTQAEGAGPGFGIETLSVPGGSMGTGTGGFTAHAPSRGTGMNRLFHLFNPSAHARKAMTELTVWDWTGDPARASFTDGEGNPLRHQLVDFSLQQYWDHKYFRVLVEASLPPLGYATCQLKEADLVSYPLFFQPATRVHLPYDNYVMDNGLIRAVFDRATAELVSLVELSSGREFIKHGDTAGLRFIETEAHTSNAWRIGRYLTEKKLDRNLRASFTDGPLRQSLAVEIPFAASTAKVIISLDQGGTAVRYTLEIDWNEAGRGEGPIPMLAFAVPSAEPVSEYLYDVPAGVQKRPALHQDVPGLQYGAALLGDRALAIVSDSKYGYRGADDRILVTLMHGANSPDPYPDRGMHKIRLSVAVTENCSKVLEETATDLNRLPAYVTGSAHAGTLPTTKSLLCLSEDTGAVLSGVKGAEDGNGLIVRLYNTFASDTIASVSFGSAIRSASAVDISEQPVLNAELELPIVQDDNSITLKMAKFTLATLRITFQ